MPKKQPCIQHSLPFLIQQKCLIPISKEGFSQSVDVRTCRAVSLPGPIGDHSDVDEVLFLGLSRAIGGGTGIDTRLGAE